MSKSDVIKLVILFQLSRFRTYKHFYIFYLQKHIKDKFPNTVSYNRFTELLDQNLIVMSLFLKTCCLVEFTGFFLSILQLLEFVNPNELETIKYSKELLPLVNLLWDGFMDLRFILS